MVTRITASVLLLFSVLFQIDCRQPLDVTAVPSSDGNALQIDLNADHSSQLLQHWLDQAMSGLMAAVATNKLERVANRTKDSHEACSKNATTVTAHAKCVVELMDNEKREERRRKVKEGAKTIEMNREVRRKPLKKLKKKKGTKNMRKGKKHLKRSGGRRKKTTTMAPIPSTTTFETTEEESFRVRRSVVSASSYSLKSSDRLSPFSGLARSLTKTVRELKHKDTGNSKDWREIIDEVQEESKRIKARKTIKKMFAKRLAMLQQDTADGGIDERRPLAMKVTTFTILFIYF